mmetsp:Transcript_23482/g.59375  ORF Transcript_23482/g.59375 Transcript_23482/m.59375 type:complete len:290 (+) Transcript_23482:15223-16092(+)
MHRPISFMICRTFVCSTAMVGKDSASASGTITLGSGGGIRWSTAEVFFFLKPIFCSARCGFLSMCRVTDSISYWLGRLSKFCTRIRSPAGIDGSGARCAISPCAKSARAHMALCTITKVHLEMYSCTSFSMIRPSRCASFFGSGGSGSSVRPSRSCSSFSSRSSSICCRTARANCMITSMFRAPSKCPAIVVMNSALDLDRPPSVVSSPSFASHFSMGSFSFFCFRSPVTGSNRSFISWTKFTITHSAMRYLLNDSAVAETFVVSRVSNAFLYLEFSWDVSKVCWNRRQ